MNGERLIERVVKCIQDSSKTDEDDVLELLIEGHNEVMRKTFLEGMIASSTVETIVTDPTTTHLAMPTDFSHELFHVTDQDADTNPIKVLNSLSIMVSKFGHLATTGIPTHVCLSGSSLVIQPVPLEVRTLSLNYYRNPVKLTLTSSPEGLPLHLHKVLEYYACMRIWSDIEDGDDGSTVNTDKFTGLFERYRDEFVRLTPQGRSRVAPPVIRGEYL